MSENPSPNGHATPAARLLELRARHDTLLQMATGMNDYINDALADIYLSEDSHADMALERRLSDSLAVVEAGLKLLQEIGTELAAPGDLDALSARIDEAGHLLAKAGPAA